MMPGITPCRFADWIAGLEGPAMKIIARNTQLFTSKLVSGEFICSRNRSFLSVSPHSLPAQLLHRWMSLRPMPWISPCNSPSASLALARRAATPAPVKRSNAAGLFEMNQDASAFRASFFFVFSFFCFLRSSTYLMYVLHPGEGIPYKSVFCIQRS